MFKVQRFELVQVYCEFTLVTLWFKNRYEIGVFTILDQQISNSI